jgi:hypothetical protein
MRRALQSCSGTRAALQVVQSTWTSLRSWLGRRRQPGDGGAELAGHPNPLRQPGRRRQASAPADHGLLPSPSRAFPAQGRHQACCQGPALPSPLDSGLGRYVAARPVGAGYRGPASAPCPRRPGRRQLLPGVDPAAGPDPGPRRADRGPPRAAGHRRDRPRVSSRPSAPRGPVRRRPPSELALPDEAAGSADGWNRQSGQPADVLERIEGCAAFSPIG